MDEEIKIEQQNTNGRDKVVNTEIEKEVKRSFIEYAMSVIIDRALPDVRDGLKPVPYIIESWYMLYMISLFHRLNIVFCLCETYTKCHYFLWI